MNLTKTTVFASFAVVRRGDLIWATTRDGADSGRIGLPGGKVDLGELPIQAAQREAAEEGLQVSGVGRLIHSAMVEGKMVQWFEFPDGTPLDDYKEKARCIKLMLVSIQSIAASGYGNEFLGYLSNKE